MKGKTILFVFGGFLMLMIISIIISNATQNKVRDFNKISLSQYLEITKEKGLKVMYVGTPSCPYCQKIEPILSQIASEMELDINYINFDELTSSEQVEFIESNKFFEGDWGMPLLLIFEDGDLKDSRVGYAEYATINEFFIKNGVGEKEVTNNDSFSSISMDEYKQIITQDEKSVVYVGTPSCPYCKKIEPILLTLKSELGISLNYINFDTLTQEEQMSLFESADVFQSQWGMPLLMIFENGVLSRFRVGYSEYDTIKEFIK